MYAFIRIYSNFLMKIHLNTLEYKIKDYKIKDPLSNLPKPSSRSMSMVGKHFLEFVVKNQDQRATNTSPEVTQVTLEKSSGSFLGKNL